MPIENATTIQDLNELWPLGGDGVKEGDNHVRQEKNVLKNIFPGASGNGFNTPITATEAEINKLAGMTSSKIELNILTGVTKTAAEINGAVSPDGIETLANKTLTSPVINSGVLNTTISGSAIDTSVTTSTTKVPTSAAVKTYVDTELNAKMVILDTPELLTSSFVSNGVFTTHNSATLNAAQAKKAIIKIFANVIGTASTNQLQSVRLGIRKVGSGISADVAQIAEGNTWKDNYTGSFATRAFGESTVNLNASYDFQHIASWSYGALSNYSVYLVGYYV